MAAQTKNPLLTLCVDLLLDVVVGIVDSTSGGIQRGTSVSRARAGHPALGLPDFQALRPAQSDLHRVVLRDSGTTPYEEVTSLLGSLFWLSEEVIDHIAWTAHTWGAAVVMECPRLEAETWVKVACARAKVAGSPLTFALEQA